MAVGKINVEQLQIWFDAEKIERVNHFKYLCRWLNPNAEPNEESRIEIRHKALMQWKLVLCNTNVSMCLRKRFLKWYVWSILLHGCESWTLKTTMLNKQEAFEPWCCSRILKISWISHTSHKNVLGIMDTQRQLLNIINRWKTEYFGYIIRGPKCYLLRLVIQGKVESKNAKEVILASQYPTIMWSYDWRTVPLRSR